MAQSVKLLSDDGVGRILESARDTFSHIVETTRAAALINWTKEAGFARQIVLRDERLLQADPDSIKNAITNVAATGLTLNPVKQHAVILSRWNDKRRCYEAQLVVMYRGLLWLAGQAGVKDISIDVVYSADRYKAVRSSSGDTWEHEISRLPHDGISNKFELVYVGARMPGSSVMKLEQIPAEDIYKARDKSDSYLDKEGKVRKNSPWVQWFDEMAKKTGLKRAQKRWEEALIETTDTHEWRRFQTAVAIDNAAEGVIPQKQDIPAASAGEESVQRLSMKQITEIEKLVEKIAPNTEKFPNNVKAYMVKLARLYKCSALDEVPANKFDELKDRLNDNLKKVQAKKDADKTGGKAQDSKVAPDTSKAAGGGSKGAQEGGGKGQGDAEGGGREPGSDDDQGDPDSQRRD